MKKYFVYPLLFTSYILCAQQKNKIHEEKRAKHVADSIAEAISISMNAVNSSDIYINTFGSIATIEKVENGKLKFSVELSASKFCVSGGISGIGLLMNLNEYYYQEKMDGNICGLVIKFKSDNKTIVIKEKGDCDAFRGSRCGAFDGEYVIKR